jgi:hypothetical protein
MKEFLALSNLGGPSNVIGGAGRLVKAGVLILWNFAVEEHRALCPGIVPPKWTLEVVTRKEFTVAMRRHATVC